MHYTVYAVYFSCYNVIRLNWTRRGYKHHTSNVKLSTKNI